MSNFWGVAEVEREKDIGKRMDDSPQPVAQLFLNGKSGCGERRLDVVSFFIYLSISCIDSWPR